MSENPADVPRGQRIPALVAHFDAVARQRGPAMNEFTAALRTLLKRRRQIFLFQRIHVDGVALHPAAERSEAQCQRRSEAHTSELQSLMRISYAVFCLKKKKKSNSKY